MKNNVQSGQLWQISQVVDMITLEGKDLKCVARYQCRICTAIKHNFWKKKRVATFCGKIQNKLQFPETYETCLSDTRHLNCVASICPLFTFHKICIFNDKDILRLIGQICPTNADKENSYSKTLVIVASNEILLSPAHLFCKICWN